MSDDRPPHVPNVDPALLKAVERALRRKHPGAYGEGEDEGDSTHGGEAGPEQSILSPPSTEGTVQTEGKRYEIPSPSPKTYLVRERAAAYRTEFFAGHLVAMAGGTTLHAAIAQNIGAHLYFRVGDRCRVYQSDLKVRSAEANAFMYPDVMVLCGEPGYVDRRHDAVTNPTVVFEVLSRGTERHDRTVKAAAYRRIESLRAYVLVSQQEPRVEVYTREEGGAWSLAVYQQYGDTVQLPAIGCELLVQEIYRNLIPAAVARPHGAT